jgi:hypothetical protein
MVTLRQGIKLFIFTLPVGVVTKSAQTGHQLLARIFHHHGASSDMDHAKFHLSKSTSVNPRLIILLLQRNPTRYEIPHTTAAHNATAIVM